MPLPHGATARVVAPTDRLNRFRHAAILAASWLGTACALSLLGANSALAAEQTITVATWNMAHMMSHAQHTRWSQFCSGFNWDESKAGATRPPELNYCNAHDGLSFPDRERESLPLRTWADYAKKTAVLRAMAEKINADIYALQEVSDEQAVRDMLPAGYRIFASPPGIAQRIAFAVRDSISVASSRTIPELSVRDHTDHAVRPGLEITVQLGERSVTMLNVHLKSGCARTPVDSPVPRPRATSVEQEKQREDCQMLHRQVQPLENWIDGQARQHSLFMVIGDFNRDFSIENRQKWPARLDGSSPAAPITPSTQFGSIWRELNDGEPAGARLTFAAQHVVPAAGKTWRCHVGIDNIVFGDDLARLLDRDASGGAIGAGQDAARGTRAPRRSQFFTAQLLPYPPNTYGWWQPMPSDHCPMVLHMKFT